MFYCKIHFASSYSTLQVQHDQLNDESIRSFLRKGKEKISMERTFVVLMYLQVRVLWRRIMQIAWILSLLHATQVSRKLIAACICPWCTQRSFPFGLSASSLPRADPCTSRILPTLAKLSWIWNELPTRGLSTTISFSVFTKFTVMSKFISNEWISPFSIANKLKCYILLFNITFNFIISLININNYKLNCLFYSQELTFFNFQFRSVFKYKNC